MHHEACSLCTRIIARHKEATQHMLTVGNANPNSRSDILRSNKRRKLLRVESTGAASQPLACQKAW